jgi:Arc/MetJ family transcription regulator
MSKAMKSSGAPTKKAAVEQALRLMVRLRSQEKIRDLWGTVAWEGDLDAMRRD